jgi:PKD repeat protein
MMKMTDFKSIAATLLLCLVLTPILPDSVANERHDPNNPGFPRLALPGISHGEAAIQNLGQLLPDVALSYGHTPGELRSRLRTDPSLHVDEGGRLLYIEEPAPNGADPLQGGAVVAGAAVVPLADTFLLHSRQGAQRVIYLDFDGHVLTGTAWNGSTTATINCPPWDIDGNPSSFGDTERTRIQGIWQRVAEDYRPFDVDVTTQYPGESAMTRTDLNDQVFGVRVLISAISSYFGNYGGIAYVGVFDYTSDFYKPALVFPENLGNGEKNIAEAASHEAGHTLGLSHDGTTTGSAYYQGSGSGETGWAPIMGVGYYQNLSQWSKGQYANANNTEDDLAIIVSNGVNYRADDHGNTAASATVLPAGSSLNASGVIERNTDADYFSFVAGAGTITVTVNPAASGPNLDILAELYNSAGVKIATGNTINSLSATISATVSAGTYYLSVRGTGQGDPLTAYSNYGSLGAYNVTGTVVASGGGNQPPIAQVSALPTSGFAPLNVQFTGSNSSDPESGLLTYSWNFGDGGTSTLANPSHQFVKSGVFPVSLTVRDPLGLGSTATLSINVQNTAPIARMTATPTSGSAPLNVSFTSSSTDSDGTIVSSQWSFGDGATASGTSASHAYLSAGTYTARLTVTDNSGMTGTTTATISVSGTPSMHVASISVANRQVSGQWYAATAQVVVVNASTGARLSGVTVTGTWSGAASGSGSALTDTSGIATISSARFKQGATATFTVTGLSKAGYVYDPQGNVVTKAP